MIDKRYVTSEFLLEHFPSPDRFHEISSNPPQSTLETSKQRYIKFRDEHNQKRQTSGHSPLSDADIVLFIKNSIGYLQMPKDLKPNQHL